MALKSAIIVIGVLIAVVIVGIIVAPYVKDFINGGNKDSDSGMLDKLVGEYEGEYYLLDGTKTGLLIKVYQESDNYYALLKYYYPAVNPTTIGLSKSDVKYNSEKDQYELIAKEWRYRPSEEWDIVDFKGRLYEDGVFNKTKGLIDLGLFDFSVKRIADDACKEYYENIIGQYEGSYTGSQGLTDATLNVAKDGNGKYTSTLDYSSPQQTGSYKMQIMYSPKRADYSFVSDELTLMGKFDKGFKGDTAVSGKIGLVGGFEFVLSHTTVGSLSGKTIFIDPGHGGTDPGAVGYLDGVRYSEADIALSIALSLREELQAQGVIVYMSHEEYSKAIDYRERNVNVENQDLVISVHLNSYGTSSPNGIEVNFKNNSPVSKAIATSVFNSLAERTQLSGTSRDKPIVANDTLRILNISNSPAIYIEVGFISNETDLRYMLNNADAIAEAIAIGVINYYK